MMNIGSKESGNSTSRNTGGTGTDGADEEEQEDSSSSSLVKLSLEATLSNFREEWQRELETAVTHVDENKNIDETYQDDYHEYEDNNEIQARQWFLQGVEYEQKGKLYEAIQYYRRAVQLVPDIEFRLYDGSVKPKERTETVSSEDSLVVNTDYQDEIKESEEDENKLDMMTRLQKFISYSRTVCSPKFEQKQTHISALPMEILLYILRWVVSSDLDLRSLEHFSMVSRGFYLCSRDSEIWRLACLRAWGVNCGGLTNYDSWREMYISRPRLNYNGCYISRTRYTRAGENSFQDQFYRPWHLVEYFRYLRFFPEGTVLMLTTPDEPVPSISLLKHRNAKNPSVLAGHYRLSDNSVIIILKRQETVKIQTSNRYRNRRNREIIEVTEQCFHIELEILPFKSKANSQLQWKRYSVIIKKGGNETCNQFEMARSKFPPFWFSRVKSYTEEAEVPLM